jgi:hypothetical protein
LSGSSCPLTIGHWGICPPVPYWGGDCQVNYLVFELNQYNMSMYDNYNLLGQSKSCTIYLGGYRPHAIGFNVIRDYLGPENQSIYTDSDEFYFINYVHLSFLEQYGTHSYIHLRLPLEIIVLYMPVASARKVANEHGVKIGSRVALVMIGSLLKGHACEICKEYVTVLSRKSTKAEKMQRCRKEVQLTNQQKDLIRAKTHQRVEKHRKRTEQHLKKTEQPPKGPELLDLAAIFPPPPLDEHLSYQIIKSATKRLQPEAFQESGCAVCGQLVQNRSLTRLSGVKKLLHVLEVPGITRQERFKASEKIREFPIAIDHSSNKVCNICRPFLPRGIIPQYALAQGLWLGEVPEELSSLRYIEKMLVSRIRHSWCSIRIASGMRKMKAHAISYKQPLPKVYSILPPPKDDIEEVLAIMFTGPCKPSAADFKRTPFLVRRNHVKKALEWLVLNHADYDGVTISVEHLNNYPEDMPPVSIEYKQLYHNKIPEGTSIHDVDVEDGTSEGECAFTVHGLTGEDLNIMTTNAVKAKALMHLNSQGKFLAVAHSDEPESIWNNPQLYPQMFPWLFPYGLGGIGSVPGIP